jgi:hypothetical protein
MQDLIWTLVGFVLTLLVFSYLFGDNFLFRVASNIFVGVSAGYVAVVVIYQVLLPRLILPLIQGSMLERLLVLVPLVMAALLLTKISTQFSSLGKLPMAYLVGVGAAVAIGGAIFGTLFGQIGGAAQPFNLSAPGGGIARLLEGLLILIGTVGTLAYFQFGAPSRGAQPAARSPIVESLALAGQVFIGITLGAMFAGVYAASLTALMDRLQFVLTVIAQLISR